LALLFFCLTLTGGPVRAEAPLEYRVKAVCLYNFAKFITWPATSFTNATAPLVLGVLGDDPFGDALTQVVTGNTVKGRPLHLVRFANLAELERAPACHILFVSASHKDQWASARAKLQGGTVLTVAEDAGFLDDGGVIRFLNESSRVRFSVNLDAARAAKLTISSELLKLAREVREQKRKK
jgi:hypothetical protein